MSLGGIRNFAWVEQGVLARGEQPGLSEDVFEALRDAGIRCVVSLREEVEPPAPGSLRHWPMYHVDHERRLAEAVGMRFVHVPLVDFSAPSPDQIARALDVLERATAERPAAYVHCRAGVGRAGLVTGAWAIAHGGSGDDVARMYQHSMQRAVASAGVAREDWPSVLRRVGQPSVRWALEHIAAALGSPVTCELELLAAEQPAGAGAWELSYEQALQPWRRARAVRPASPV